MTIKKTAGTRVRDKAFVVTALAVFFAAKDATTNKNDALRPA
jgi:hypothetical protein